MKDISADEAVQLRCLDEQERLLWQEYSETHSAELLQNITKVTARKDEIYGISKRNEDI